MKTYKGISDSLDRFFQAEEKAFEESKTLNLEAAVEKAYKVLESDFAALSDAAPMVFPMKVDVEKVLGNGQVAFFEKIESLDKKHFRLPLIFSGNNHSINIGGSMSRSFPYLNDCVPDYVHWESGVASIGRNYIVPFLLDMLLSMPVGTIKLTFVANGMDPSCIDPIISNLDGQYYGGSILAARETRELVEHLKDRRLKMVQQYADYPQYCEEHQQVEEPYEVLVVMGHNGWNSSEFEQFISQNSMQKAGVYVVNVENTTTRNLGGIIVPNVEDNNNTPHSIFSDERIQRWCFDYLNKKIGESAPSDTESIASGAYQPIEDMMEVSVGANGSRKIMFRLNTVDHVHAFINGKSGSGKSVFLHNIIAGAILKYSPEELELYLLDFKIGGVEFNRYKGVKQVKALLVDNSDQQITLEILKALHDSMTERGRKLRSSGYNKIDEYNKANPDKKMPHVLVVADECHDLFRTNDEARYISKEITDILSQIAKEGRSQGVHLIFATQTLSGTNISNDILHNVTDHYLLQCAASDSERLVSGSSHITSKLKTGEILYHHAEQQVQFKAYYTEKAKADELVKVAIAKSEGHRTNGEYYFNGSQQFDLSADIIAGNKKGEMLPVAYLGKSISLRQNDIKLCLRRDFSENVLVLGLNDEEQNTRTVMSILLSVALGKKKGGADQPRICLIDCLAEKKRVYANIIETLQDRNLCEVVSGRASFLKQLAEDVKAGNAKPMVLFILGQDRFRELKLDMDLAPKADTADDKPNMFGLSGFSHNASSLKTFRQAMSAILERGPECGVHTVIQLEKVTNLLFSDMMPREINSKFKHLVMLRSDEKTASRMGLTDEIRLELLDKDTDRLRAYYYSGDSDSYALFTPYQIDKDSINIIK